MIPIDKGQCSGSFQSEFLGLQQNDVIYLSACSFFSTEFLISNFRYKIMEVDTSSDDDMPLADLLPLASSMKLKLSDSKTNETCEI